MPKNHTQSGSALLIVVLIMATISTIVLTASKAAIDSTRVGTSIGNADVARQMAESGIEEGMLRYSQAALVGNEYGQGAVQDADSASTASYSLLPMRRGYVRGASPACGVLGKDDGSADTTGTFDPDCPYYDLAVRSTVAMNFDTNSQQIYRYDARLFPSGTRVSQYLNIKRFAPFSLTPQFQGGSGQVYIESCDQPDGSGTCTGVTATDASPAIFPLPAQTQPRSIAITLQSGTLSTIVLASAASTGELAIEKGYVTIDAAGFAGGQTVRLLGSIFPHDTTSATAGSFNLVDFAQSFDAKGFLR